MSEQPGVAPFTRRPKPRAVREPAPEAGTGTDGYGAGREPVRQQQLRRLVVAGAGQVVSRCRGFTREALTDWGWLPAPTAEQRAAVDDVLLVVSELVTNACLHAGGPQELRLLGGGELLRIEVSDRAPQEPTRRSPHQSGRPGGHGMFIVARLSADWGVVQQADGKTVWVDMLR